MEQVQIVTLDPSIQSVADLEGQKCFGSGAAGSGVYYNAVDVLGAYGLDIEKDINPTYQSFGDSAEALQDGKIDAAFVVSGCADDRNHFPGSDEGCVSRQPGR